MPDSKTQVIRQFTLQALPVGMFGELDSEPLELIEAGTLKAEEASRRFQVSPEILKYARKQGIDPRLLAERSEALQEFRRVWALTYQRGEQVLNIVDVLPDGPVLSDRPFAVIVRFQNAGEAPLTMASVEVSWAGEPFTIQHELETKSREGELRLEFDEEHALPVGQAEFFVRLFRDDGAAASFRRSVYVLPGNPLSLSLGPAGARVTGSWSARGDYQPPSDTFLTEVEITLANGDGSPVGMNRQVSWEFWDGPVAGGSRIESGGFNWNSAISVPAHGVWRGTCWFSSPRGSGIFNTYDRKEDMAISISMTASDGRVVRGEITARVMLSYGVNIIKVGDFGAQEHVDLYAAVDAMRQMYERRDITLSSVGRYIINNSLAGSYTIINSEDEVRDMWEDWSVPNGSVDIYVVQDFSWDSYNGYAGDIPGPASKGGRKDGVAVQKTSFVDGSGTQRLSVTTLSQLIGHEVGHYLGLEHQETTNNLMRGNTGVRGPDLDYQQYRTMFPHGFMHYE